jgi:enamine deaminase RidA (YjgF/YER057c/UK114 family)
VEPFVQKTFVRGTWQQKRAFSPAVIIAGPAKTIYVAGHTGQKTEDGTPITDFAVQCRRTFQNIEVTLAEAGAKLSDLVTMTVFLTDVRHTTSMTEIREEIFGKDFPASAALTVTGFAQPEILIEIQGIAVIS